MNKLLREQLDQAHLANQQLSDDVRRFTTELQQVREELSKKTKDWKEEERVSHPIIPAPPPPRYILHTDVSK